MSGGAYDYAYCKIEEFRFDLSKSANTPERKAFVKLLERVTEAVQAIVGNDSGDGDSEELELIKSAIGEGWRERVIEILIEDAKKLIEELTEYTQES